MIENLNGSNLVDIPRKMFQESLSRNVRSYPQFLLIDHEHKALLGTIDMSSVNWFGSLRYYNDVSNFSRNNAVITKEIYEGCGDAAFLAQDRFAVVGDKGAVEIFQIVQTTDEHHQALDFQSLNCACYHDNSVYTVSAFFNSKSIVTGGLDCCIKVWDVESLIATHSYSFAHTDCITGTDIKPMCDSTFASTSLDGDASMWDIRQSKPGLCILSRKKKYSSISWNTIMDHFIVIGGDDGMISLMDIRHLRKPLFELILDDRGVWKMLFNPNPMRKEQLACCFDSTSVKVLDISKEMQVIMEDNEHTDYVRGLAWCKDDLFSCALDDNVIKRAVPSSDDR